MRIVKQHIMLLLFILLPHLVVALPFQAAVADIKMTLSDAEKNTLDSFANILIQTGLKQEAKIYQYAATEQIQFYATFIKYQNQLYVLAPFSLTSLSQKHQLQIKTLDGKTISENNLEFLSEIDNIAIFKVPNIEKFQNIPWREFAQTPPEASLFVGSEITLLEPDYLIETLKMKELKFHMMGSLALNRDLSPTGLLGYSDGHINILPLKNLFARILLLSQKPKSTNNSLSLQKDIEDFIVQINEQSFSTANEFLSQNLIYQFGCAAYLYNKNNEKLLGGLITNLDIKRGGLYPLAKSIMALFMESNEKTTPDIRFRIIVSMAEQATENASIVTLSINKNIVPTSWKLGKTQWQLDSLPVPFQNKLLPYLSYDAQKILDVSIRPFSGLFFEYNMAFHPVEIFQGDQISGYMGYNLNFTRYLSMNFKLGVLGLMYKTEFDRAGGHESYQTLVQLLVAKVGLWAHYPIMIGKNVYLMPFIGVDLGIGYPLAEKGDPSPYFEDLLINRVPVTMIVGWQTGLEIGFNAGLPMAIGLTAGYDQDFFGEQTMKKGPSGANAVKGAASEFYASIYYKIGLQKLKNKS